VCIIELLAGANSFIWVVWRFDVLALWEKKNRFFFFFFNTGFFFSFLFFFFLFFLCSFTRVVGG